MKMTTDELRAQARITPEFEHVIARRRTWSRDGVWYTAQKEPWLGWLPRVWWTSGPGITAEITHTDRRIVFTTTLSAHQSGFVAC